MHYELRRVAVWPAIRIGFVLYGLVGLFVGALAGMVTGLLGVSAAEDLLLPFGGVLPLGVSVILLPFVVFAYALAGAFAAGLGALVYNQLAKWIGGIELTLEAEGNASDGTPGVGNGSGARVFNA